MRLKLISCQVFCREVAAGTLRSSNQVEIEFLPKGWHETGCGRMSQRLQAAVDAVDPSRYQAVLLAYGFCNHGIAGLRARSLPLVAPRAQDCITLLLGGRARFDDYFERHPGTYFQSSGWIEHRRNPAEVRDQSFAEQNGLNWSFEELSLRYGPENAAVLFEVLGHQTRHYGQLTYIDMGVERTDRVERESRKTAVRRGWRFEKLSGDLTLLQRLVDGDWTGGDFVVVPPGWQIAPRYDQRIIEAEKASR